MRINTNVNALNSYGNMIKNTEASGKSMEKLSSGLRINKASDDAAGLAISEKMRSQIRGLDQAQRNAQDGISLIQTAEGALNETESILQRMRELSVQASNDTNTADDRAAIQTEINQLTQEIDRIADTTEFNTKKLLNGNSGSNATVDSANTAKIDTAEVVDATLESGVYTLTVAVDTATAIDDFMDAGTGIQAADITLNTPANASYGSYQLTVENDADNAGMKKFTLIDSVTGDQVASQNNVDAGTDTIELAGIQIDTTNYAGNGTVTFDVEGDLTFTLKDAGANTLATVTVDNYNQSEIEIKGINFSFNADITDAGTADITVMNNSLSLQIGANSGQTMSVAINDMSSEALGVNDLDITTASGAESAITTIDTAIKSVSSERAKLGAYQNRLDHTINNLGTSSENLTAAESRIRDVDMAKEMMEFSKYNILSQAAQSMLAQANQQPQSVLQLLK